MTLAARFGATLRPRKAASATYPRAAIPKFGSGWITSIAELTRWVAGEPETEVVAAAVARACGVRFALLLWHGHRFGQVKSATPGSRYYDRQTNRIFYWMFMGAHTLVLSVCLWAVVYIVFDLLRTPR